MSKVHQHHHNYTYEQYAALEMDSTTKHEFLDGEIIAMAGGSDEHSRLQSRIGWALNNAVEKHASCDVHTSDLRIYIEAFRVAVFPDASVICGPLQRHEPGPETTALNPSIIVEVTSDSSEDYDTHDKLELYRAIPTLREYVIVSHRERRVTVHARGESDAWSTTVAIKGGTLNLPSLGASLSVDEIYRNSTISAD